MVRWLPLTIVLYLANFHSCVLEWFILVHVPKWTFWYWWNKNEWLGHFFIWWSSSKRKNLHTVHLSSKIFQGMCCVLVMKAITNLLVSIVSMWRKRIWCKKTISCRYLKASMWVIQWVTNHCAATATSLFLSRFTYTLEKQDGTLMELVTVVLVKRN